MLTDDDIEVIRHDLAILSRFPNVPMPVAHAVGRLRDMVGVLLEEREEAQVRLSESWRMLDIIAVDAKQLADVAEDYSDELCERVNNIANGAIRLLRKHEVPDPVWGKRMTRQEQDEEEDEGGDEQ